MAYVKNKVHKWAILDQNELQSGKDLMLKVRSLAKQFKMTNHNEHGIIILQKSADGDE